MPNWDIFHSDRLEVERNLDLDAVRAAVGRGEVVADDLARTAGSGEPWVRLSENAALWATFTGRSASTGATRPKPGQDDPPITRVNDAGSLRSMLDDDSDEEAEAIDSFDDDADPVPRGLLHTGSEMLPDTPPLPDGTHKATTEDLDPGFPDGYDRDLDLSLREPRSTVNLDDDEDEYDPEAEDEEAAEFTFTRSGAETVEELDLAAMVDVAFQLVLFFLVTASTVMFKTLEVPKPKPEEGKGSAQQTTGRTIETLEKDYILVEIDANGEVKIDHEKSPNDFAGLTNKLRDVRAATGRNAIILTADSLTAHKNAVLAYDAANEVSLAIAIATPKSAPDKAAVPPPVVPK
jgi:biopolymer transport protein ExbD